MCVGSKIGDYYYTPVHATGTMNGRFLPTRDACARVARTYIVQSYILQELYSPRDILTRVLAYTRTQRRTVCTERQGDFNIIRCDIMPLYYYVNTRGEILMYDSSVTYWS